MFRVSVSTLRHYEKIGLLAPEYVDPATGYRSYSTRQFECLNTIRYLRALEMPLEQIRDFLQDREVGKIQGMLLQQRQALQAGVFLPRGEHGVHPQLFAQLQGGKGVPAHVKGPVEGETFPCPVAQLHQLGQALPVQVPRGGEEARDYGVRAGLQQGGGVLQQQRELLPGVEEIPKPLSLIHI